MMCCLGMLHADRKPNQTGSQGLQCRAARPQAAAATNAILLDLHRVRAGGVSIGSSAFKGMVHGHCQLHPTCPAPHHGHLPDMPWLSRAISKLGILTWYGRVVHMCFCHLQMLMQDQHFVCPCKHLLSALSRLFT